MGLLAGLDEIGHRLFGHARLFIVMRQLYSRLCGLVPIEALQCTAHGFMQIGALGDIQAMVEIVLEENVAKAIARQPLATVQVQRLSGHQAVLAIQFAKDRIRCNVIHPGIVDTPLQAPYLTEELRREFQTGIPLGRIAHPREIAFAALFLASEESAFMTGAELVVDGGFMAQ